MLSPETCTQVTEFTNALVYSSAMLQTISFTLNDKPVRVRVDDDRMLLWVLRYELGLTGTKFGCGAGVCGACTVIVENEAIRSCATSIKDVAGKHVLTVEGLEKDGQLHPLQQAFVKHHAFQCGYCTPGMLMNAYALLQRNPQPTANDIIKHMDDNLCRCGSHVRVVDAILEVAASKERA